MSVGSWRPSAAGLGVKGGSRRGGENCSPSSSEKNQVDCKHSQDDSQCATWQKEKYIL